MPGPDQTKNLFQGDGKPLSDEEIEAFAASLEASIEAFRHSPLPVPKEPSAPGGEETGAAPPRPGPETASARTPMSVPPTAVAAAVTAAVAAPVPPSAPGGGLLEELRSAAARQIVSAESERHEREQRDAQLAKAMRDLWKYLNELSRHLATLKPPVPHSYRLGPRAEIDGLTWTESFCDYRSLSTSESAPLDSISLHYTLSAPGTIRVERLPQQVHRYQEELALLRLHYLVREHKNERGAVDSVVFAIDRQIKVALLFKAQYDVGQIVFRGKNFNGFGPATYTIAPAAVTAEFLDDLGRFFLGRPNRLLAALTPVLTLD